MDEALRQAEQGQYSEGDEGYPAPALIANATAAVCVLERPAFVANSASLRPKHHQHHPHHYHVDAAQSMLEQIYACWSFWHRFSADIPWVLHRPAEFYHPIRRRRSRRKRRQHQSPPPSSLSRTTLWKGSSIADELLDVLEDEANIVVTSDTAVLAAETAVVWRPSQDQQSQHTTSSTHHQSSNALMLQRQHFMLRNLTRTVQAALALDQHEHSSIVDDNSSLLLSPDSPGAETVRKTIENVTLSMDEVKQLPNGTTTTTLAEENKPLPAVAIIDGQEQYHAIRNSEAMARWIQRDFQHQQQQNLDDEHTISNTVVVDLVEMDSISSSGSSSSDLPSAVALLAHHDIWIVPHQHTTSTGFLLEPLIAFLPECAVVLEIYADDDETVSVVSSFSALHPQHPPPGSAQPQQHRHNNNHSALLLAHHPPTLTAAAAVSTVAVYRYGTFVNEDDDDDGDTRFAAVPQLGRPATLPPPRSSMCPARRPLMEGLRDIVQDWEACRRRRRLWRDADGTTASDAVL